jgi:hypothetical protein
MLASPSVQKCRVALFYWDRFMIQTGDKLRHGSVIGLQPAPLAIERVNFEICVCSLMLSKCSTNLGRALKRLAVPAL